MIWLGTVVLKPGAGCAQITWRERLAMAATGSHRRTTAPSFNDLRSFSNTTHLSYSPWRRGLLCRSVEALLKARQVRFVVAGHGTGAPEGKFAGGGAEPSLSGLGPLRRCLQPHWLAHFVRLIGHVFVLA